MTDREILNTLKQIQRRGFMTRAELIAASRLDDADTWRAISVNWDIEKYVIPDCDHNAYREPINSPSDRFTLSDKGLNFLQQSRTHARSQFLIELRGWITTVISVLAFILSVLSILNATETISIKQWMVWQK